MHIALDLDDVILAFCEGLRIAVKTEFGVDIEPFTKWEISDVLDPIIGYPWMEWLENRDWLWANFPAIEGAIGHIERLRAQGHYLEIVTTKPDWAEYSVWKWLGKWRPHVNRVTIVGMGHAKSEFTDAVLLVDDRPANCQEWVESRADRVALLYSQPHNMYFHALGEDRIHRVYDWGQVCTFVDKLVPSE